MVKFFTLTIFLFYTVCSSSAAIKTWIGASGGTYSTGTNWSGGTPPTSLDDIVFNTTVTVIIDGAKTVNSLTITGNSSVLWQGNNASTIVSMNCSSCTSSIDVGSTLTVTGTTNSNKCELTMVSSAIFNINGTLNLGITGYTGTTRLNATNGSVITVNGALNMVGSGTSVSLSSITNYIVNGVQEMKRTGGQFPVGSYAITARNIISGCTAAYPTFTSSQVTTWGIIEFNAPNNTTNGSGGACIFSSNAICQDFRVINTNTGNCTLAASGSTARVLTVNGNLTSNSGTVLNINSTSAGANSTASGINALGTVNIQGDVASTGSATGSFIAFTGTTNQPITIAGTITNDVSLNFNNATGFVLGSNITMSGTANSILSFTNGLINGGTYTLANANTNPASLVGGSATAYLYNGKLKRGIAASTGSYNYPLGNAANYKPGNINFTTAPSTSGTLTGSFSIIGPNFPNPSLVEGTINNISICSIQGSWFMDKDAALTPSTYAATFTSNGNTDISDYTKLVLVKRPTTPANGNWSLDGTHITTTGSNTAAVLQRTDITTGFSEFGIGGEINVSLPTTILTFNANITGATNTVYWTTTTEVNNRKFVVQRSANGANFSNIGEVTTQAMGGNSSTALNYTFVDAAPLTGKAYYRLQVVDNANGIKNSGIVTLRRGAGQLEIVDVKPNPTTGTVYFNVLGTSTTINVNVLDLSGKTVIRKGLVQTTNFSVDMSKLANGMYILQAIDAQTGEKALFKVLKN